MNENKNNTSVSLADLELTARNKSLEKNGYKKVGSQCSIHIHSRRYTLCDSDGISAKAAIDGLVLSGILVNDSPEEVKEVSYSQEKIEKDKEEETIITIEIVE